MLILGRVTRADQARQEQLAATLGRRPGAGPERHRNGSRLPDQGWKVVSTDVTGGLRVAQSRPNPRGGSTLSSSARSRVQIASSWCASADS